MLFVLGEPTYCLDCRFNDEMEDYEDFYLVYEVDQVLEAAPTGSWLDLNMPMTYLGKVPLRQVSFDASKRKFVDMDFLEKVKKETSEESG